MERLQTSNISISNGNIKTLKLFNANIGSLKFLLTLFDTYVATQYVSMPQYVSTSPKKTNKEEVFLKSYQKHNSLDQGYLLHQYKVFPENFIFSMLQGGNLQVLIRIATLSMLQYESTSTRITLKRDISKILIGT